MNTVSKGNHYHCSDGSTVSKSYVNRKVTQAKKAVIEAQREQIGHNCCQECGVSQGVYLDCAHTVSVDECQKSGRTELAWDPQNIRILCRKHHEIHDKRYLGGSKNEN